MSGAKLFASTDLRALAVFHLSAASGPSRSLEGRMRWLSELGSLEVIVPGPGAVADRYREFATVSQLRYETLVLPSGGRALGRAAYRFARDVRTFRALLRSGRPDVVISVTTMLPALLVAARLEHVPTVVHAAEIYAKGYVTSRGRRAAAWATSYLNGRLSNAVIACSHAVAAQFAGVGQSELVAVYPPIGDGYGDGDGPAFRARFGIGADDPLVAAVGNLTHGRGQDILVAAMTRLRRSFPTARCVIAGDPFPREQDLAYRDRLEDMIRRRELEDAVTLAGHVDDVTDLYAAADVVVNPARANESFGRVAFEAAIAGRPIVTTRVGAVGELLEDEDSALLVPSEDPAELASAVARLLDDEVLSRRLASRAAAIARRRLAPQIALDGFAAVLEKVLGRQLRSEPGLNGALGERSSYG
jgi:glycosyltransferase involved in cell wall biosynthesis